MSADTKQIHIADATEAHLRYHLGAIMGVDTNGKESLETLKAYLKEAGWTRDFVVAIEVPEPSEGGSDRVRRRARPKANPEDPAEETRYEVQIRIHTTERAGGKEPVPVSVNGRAIWLPRGRDIWVWEEHVNVLDRAEEQIYPEYNAEEDMRGGLKEPTMVKLYPFSYV